MDERVIKYYINELSKEERYSLLKEALTNKELEQDLMDMQQIDSLISLHPNLKDESLGQHKYAEFRHRIIAKKRIKFTISFLRIAAVAALLIVGTKYISYWGVMNELSHHTQELFVPAGQRAKIKLPDGSIAWLNANSHLTYPSVFGKERRVILSGEGFFSVAKDKKHPFIVSTNKLDIQALGTKFNVYNYPSRLESRVFLLEGSVKVTNSRNNQCIAILKPNQRLLFENNKISVNTDLESRDLYWEKGIYAVNNQTLNSIIVDLELYFDVDIIVKNEKILNYRYTGKFHEKDGVMEILRILCKTHEFKITKDDEENKIYLSV